MMRRFGTTDPRIEEYIAGLVPASKGVLADMEAHADREGIPIVGRVEGHFLYTLALACKAKEILEVGTAIGYSATWLSWAAQRDEGRVVTIERDEGHAAFAEAYLRQAGLGGLCMVRRGDALTLMRGMEESFDIIFLDVLTQLEQAGTALELLDLSLRRLRQGGILLSDNAFRSGEVINPAGMRPSTQGIAAFNHAIANHTGLVTSFIPMRDGISMSVKIE